MILATKMSHSLEPKVLICGNQPAMIFMVACWHNSLLTMSPDCVIDSIYLWLCPPQIKIKKQSGHNELYLFIYNSSQQHSCKKFAVTWISLYNQLLLGTSFVYDNHYFTCFCYFCWNRPFIKQHIWNHQSSSFSTVEQGRQRACSEAKESLIALG